MANTKITTNVIADDAITGAKIADDAINSEHYTDGSIDTAHIADDQVTLAKMAGLARGKIIYGDSSGNPAVLAVGSAGTVLTSDGTDISWAEEVATNYLPLAGGTMTGNIAHAGDFTLDIGGDIILDADGGDIVFKDGGSSIGRFKNNSGNFVIKSEGSDDDLKFLGNDGGSEITALTLDMSDAGSASFNNHITATGNIYTGGNVNLTADDKKIRIGAGEDLILTHDGSNSHITNDYGVLYIDQRVNDGNLVLRCDDMSGGLHDYFYLDGGSGSIKGKAIRDIEWTSTATNSTAGHHIFKSYNTEIMRIDGANNRVGIGTTSPAYGLDVRNTIYSSVAATTKNLTLGDSTNGTTSAISTNNNDLIFYHDGSTESMRIDSTGVGIGTDSPDCDLEVNGATNSEQVIITGGGNSSRGLSISTAANGGQNDAHVIFNAQDTGHADYPTMSFQTGGTERMRLTPDGKLTVGATTANHKIEAHSGAVASKYDGTDHIAIRALSGGQYIQYGSGRALTFMRIDTYPNSGASHTMSLSGSKVRIGASSPSLAGLLSVEGGNAGVPALFVSNTNTDSVGIRSQVNSNGAGNYIYYAVNSGGGVWKIRNDGDHSGTDTSIGSLSDSRLKKDVTDLTYDINKFKQYRPVEFNWKNPSLHKSASGKSRGFLAQEIGAIDTYYVDKYEAQGDDIPLVDEDGMAHGTKFGYKDAMYISVIKQLITRLEAAEAKITALEG